MEKKFVLPEFGYEVVIGKYATQANGAAWFSQGGNVILATAVSQSSSEFPGFLPLTTDYKEQFAAAGKIPGGYLKREGKSSDKEVLISRIIDRSIRPLFPLNYFNQLQVLATVYSVDKIGIPSVLSIIASSVALTVSDIPFLGPIGAVEVVRIDGQWITNPTYEQSIQSDVNITVVGTDEGITMVEGRTNQISEDEFVNALFLAHDVIKKQVAWQKEIASELKVQKESITDLFDWDSWKVKADEFLTPALIDNLFVYDKVARDKAMNSVTDLFFEKYLTEAQDSGVSKTFLGFIFDNVLKQKLTKEVFVRSKRIDGRDFDQVRPISTEVGLLPFNHGSALFNRGRTQALVSLTLGGGQDEQRVDDIMQDTVEKSFMLHYNYLPFSGGEVRPLRGPGRREIGHGHLAASSFKYVLPDAEKFPYTIRIVTDILESDGSSSMATVCGSTMAFLNAGVPISHMVSGIAMGLMADGIDDFRVLSDISGIEDAFGLMDFKVAGTEFGITAIQMDIKYKGGLSRQVFEKALKQSKISRLHILNEMKKVMTAPNTKLSDLVPQIISFKVPKDKIGAIIGQGGKVIREIIEKTGTSIDIEDDGLVKIFGQLGPKFDQAVNWVKTLGGQIEKGTIYNGRVKKVAEFGIFVEVAPGVDGLVHVSNMPSQMQSDFQNKCKLGDTLKVEVLDYDEYTGRIRLKIIQ